MQDEIACLGMVHCALGGGFPGVIGFLVVREGADEVDLRQVLELDIGHVLQLTAKDDVQQLPLAFRGVAHFLLLRSPGGTCRPFLRVSYTHKSRPAH